MPKYRITAERQVIHYENYDLTVEVPDNPKGEEYTQDDAIDAAYAVLEANETAPTKVTVEPDFFEIYTVERLPE